VYKRRAFLGSLVATALVPRAIPAFAQTPVASPALDRAAAIDALLDDPSVDVPFSGAALIVDQGEVVLDAAYGLANGTDRERNTTGTAFQIASITKTIAATLILQLRDEAAFDLDDSASDFIPQFAAQLDSGATPVTIRQLLNHTSGVPDFLEVFDPFDIDSYPSTLDQLLDGVAEVPLLFDPGEGWHYSNTGYLYLGRITEAVTGTTWEERLNERIIRPLGLRRTWLTEPGTPGALATGYLPIGGFVLPVSRFGRPDLAEAAGGLTSTTHDVLAWLDAFMAGEVVSAETVSEMLDPGEYGYGLGWEIIGTETDRWSGHFGQTIGFRTAMFRHHGADRSIVLLSNRQDHPIESTVNAIRDLLTGA
jgi:D-alanyl-D-alanine carboxypeptidase